MPRRDASFAGANAVAPAGTITISNRRLGYLTAGDVGPSGKGKLFTSDPEGSNLREHDRNFVNGGKFISRVEAGDQVMRLDTEGDKPFLAACADEQSQKWGTHRNRDPR